MKWWEWRDGRWRWGGIEMGRKMGMEMGCRDRREWEMGESEIERCGECNLEVGERYIYMNI
jgi:hypothetical protein